MSRLNPEEVDALLAAAGTSAAVYLIGAGGCGMSGLGHLLLDLEFTVAGSDVMENDDVRLLRSRGAQIHHGHAVAQITAAHPVLAVYSSAIRMDNPELVAAQQLQIPIVRRAVLLAALLRRQRGICVAGMHGKTTTTALLAFALQQLHAEPSYAVGAAVPQLARHARFFHAETIAAKCSAPSATQNSQADARPGGWFVVEADESDGTLREFQPEHAIVLNVDEEHLDYYANFEAICDEFQRFAEQTSGHLIYCADDPQLVAQFARRSNAISYGFNPLANYRIESSVGGAIRSSRFEIWRGNENLGEFAIQLLGEKNISNAAAAITLLHQLDFAAADIARAIAPFQGAARRQQELFCDERFRLFDDYGHHPREISATLRALKSLGGRRLLVAFQPHRFTRTQHLIGQFATCFAEADQLWVTDVYAASEAEIPGVNGAALAAAIRGHQPVAYVATPAQLPTAMRAAMQPGDVVLFLGAGDITLVAHQLAAQLREEMSDTHAQLRAELAAKLSPAAVVRCDEPLAKRTTLRVGGPADFYVEPSSEADLAAVLQFCAAREMPFVTLGRGSNLLIKDDGIRGVVISLAHPQFSQVQNVGERLICGAGAKLRTVSGDARRAGLTGLEFLEGIPGSVGGALRMNAGAMGGAMFDVVESIRFMDSAGQVFERATAEVPVEYRRCPLLKNHLALGTVLRGRPAPQELIKERLDAFNKKRWASQPHEPSAGCIFKNPGLVSAGKLIDELGLKGTRVGGARVSEVHGNFIVNDGSATAQDVLSLIALVQQRAKIERGIELETEVQITGE